MNYQLHPEAVAEHEEQVAYYETQAEGLGWRYHQALLSTLRRICEAPRRFPTLAATGLRHARLPEFPFRIIFRERSGVVQVLAVAHYRRRPAYWARRR